MQATIVRLSQVYPITIVFTLKNKALILYKININYFLLPFFYAICSSIQNHCFTFLFFYYIIMYNLIILNYIKKMRIKELKEFIFNKQIGFTKGNSY